MADRLLIIINNEAFFFFALWVSVSYTVWHSGTKVH